MTWLRIHYDFLQLRKENQWRQQQHHRLYKREKNKKLMLITTMMITTIRIRQFGFLPNRFILVHQTFWCSCRFAMMRTHNVGIESESLKAGGEMSLVNRTWCNNILTSEFNQFMKHLNRHVSPHERFIWCSAQLAKDRDGDDLFDGAFAQLFVRYLHFTSARDG